jgi:hypothetical protein
VIYSGVKPEFKLLQGLAAMADGTLCCLCQLGHADLEIRGREKNRVIAEAFGAGGFMSNTIQWLVLQICLQIFQLMQVL